MQPRISWSEIGHVVFKAIHGNLVIDNLIRVKTQNCKTLNLNRSPQNQGNALFGDKLLWRRMISQGRRFFFTAEPQMAKQVQDHQSINHANNDRSRYNNINVSRVRISICSNFKSCRLLCNNVLQLCTLKNFIFSPNAFIHSSEFRNALGS